MLSLPSIPELVLAAAGPAVFYAISARYVVFRPSAVRQFGAVLLGAAVAGALFFLAPLWESQASGAVARGTRAALVEKGALWLLLWALVWTERERDTGSFVAEAVLVGLGFAFFENVAYAGNARAPVAIRLLGPTPMHAATVGLMGYWISLAHSVRHPVRRIVLAGSAFLLPVGAHALFDSLLFSGGIVATVCAAGSAALLTLLLDYVMVSARTVPAEEILSGLGLRYEDWRMVQRQAQFERWVLSEAEQDEEPVFQVASESARHFVAGGLLLFSTLYWPLREQVGGFFPVLRPHELAAFLSFLPAMAGGGLLILGSINPRFVRRRRIRIPTVLDVRLAEESGTVRTENTYEVTLRGCFLRTTHAIPLGQRFTARFRLVGGESPPVACRVVWDNHRNVRQEFGTVIVFERAPAAFGRMIMSYHVWRAWHGLLHSLRLPGFRTIRALFVRPETVMQTLRRFPADTLLFEEGEHGTEFFQIKSGQVEISRQVGDRRVRLAELGPGELFGELAIAGAIRRNASAVCLSECTLAVADGAELDYLIHENPRFARELLQLTAQRFLATGDSFRADVLEVERAYDWQRAQAAAGLRLLIEGLGHPPEDGAYLLNLDGRRVREAAGAASPETIRALLRALLSRSSPGGEPAGLAASVRRVLTRGRVRLRLPAED